MLAADTVVESNTRLALGIEYTGSAYRGWQRQAHADSIQAQIEDALEKILLTKVVVTCAGRTDAGVHATAQVIHFDVPVARPIKAFTRGVNTVLPPDIAVTWAHVVNHDFHARYSAFARRYRYIIYNYPFRSGVFANGATHVYEPLDETRMHEAAQHLLGEQDFTSFRASHCQSNTPFRCVHSCKVTRQQNYVVIEIQANAFLHHMVRNIAGTLIKIGSGEQEPIWVKELLLAKDRTVAAATAKPHGLYLVEVDYPPEFDLPKTELGPLFLA